MNKIHILSPMMISCLMKLCVAIVLLMFSRHLCGQSIEVTTRQTEFNQIVSPTDQLVPKLVFQKINSRKSYTFLVGQKVWVASRKTRNGKIGFKPAVITKIKNHQITFTPISKKFEEYTVSDSTLNYIEFANAGSVARGVVVNAVLVTAIVVVVTFTLFDFLISPFTGNEPILSSMNGFNPINIPWDDFHKHIKVITLRGKRKWNVEVVEMI